MKLYASMVINGSEGWGDGFPAMWFSEYLFRQNPDLLIDLYGAGNADSSMTLSLKMKHRILRSIYDDLYTSETRISGIESSRENNKVQSVFKILNKDKIVNFLDLIRKEPFHHSSYIRKPAYISQWLFGPPSPTHYDEILLTHYNHSETGLSWASPPILDLRHGGLMPPLSVWKGNSPLPKVRRMDLNADLLNILINEKFVPSMPELKRDVLDELSILPDRYVCIQIRSRDTGPLNSENPTRNSLSGRQYYEWMDKFVEECWEKWRLPIVFTSGSIESECAKVVDASRLSLWAKIETHRRACYSYVAHSGFGMIVAVYRGLMDTKLINPSLAGMYRNPPVLLFSNVHDKRSPEKYTSSPPGWVDQSANWCLDLGDSMKP